MGICPIKATSSIFPESFGQKTIEPITTHKPNTVPGIAQFLEAFARFYRRRVDAFEHQSEASTQVSENYKYLKAQIKNYLFAPSYDDDNKPLGDLNCEVIQRQSFGKRGLHHLFEKLNSISDKQEQDKVVSWISDHCDAEEFQGLVRTVLFSWYVLKCVVLTRVETDSEDYAFDIFDALNTTGEPLTAIETLKPYVIRWEKTHNSQQDYRGSLSEEEFERISRDLYEQFPDTDKRQKETKQLLVAFALYHDGVKLGLNLGIQRNHFAVRVQRRLPQGERRRTTIREIDG